MSMSMAEDNTMLSENHVIRFRDACAETGVSIATMRRYIKAGTGPRMVRLSERIHGFKRADLNAWVESRAR